MLFVVRFAGEPDVRWRALNARNSEEARVQALSLAFGEWVEYGAVDPETGDIAVLGTIGGGSNPVDLAAFEREPERRTLSSSRTASHVRLLTR